MIIAVDFDGTFIEKPIRYTDLITQLRRAGNVVGILTGRTMWTQGSDEEILAHYRCRVDFFWNTGLLNRYELEICDWISDEKISMERDLVISMFKARICKERRVAILIDDAADKIRMFDCGETIVLKSPTEFNKVVPRWENHLLTYNEEGQEL